ncbi:phytanoyl-CoA dioxygenase family protein [Luminiphilus sp.]|nr:phytanoyl-CoA dioxygenase family protein [Luminiphilus sp.]
MKNNMHHNYKSDINYRFSWGTRREKIKAQFAVFKMLSKGLLRTLYEYVKFYVAFPALYRIRQNSGIRIESSAGPDLLDEWRLDGFSSLKLDASASNLILEYINKGICNLSNIDTRGDPRFKFHLSKVAHPRLFDLISQGLASAGALALARDTIKRENLRLEEMYLFIQDTSNGWRDELPELREGGARESSRYLHVDSTPPNRVVKFIIYLNEVSLENGAFQYLPGSHRVESPGRAFVRRWIHHSRIQGMDEWSRRLFSLLPTGVQHKAEWGNDVEVSASKLDLASIEGGSGTVALFDNSGSHRGGLIISGRRVSIHGGFR